MKTPFAWLTFCLAVSASPLVADSLVSYWPLDEIQLGKTPDVVSGYDLEAVNVDASALVAGVAGQALRFQPADQTLLVRTHEPDEALPATRHEAFSVSLWVKGDGIGQQDLRVFSEGSSSSDTPLFNIGTDASGNSGLVDIFIRPGSNHTLSSREAFDDQWHHLAWVQSAESAMLFIDDAEAGAFQPSAIADLDITSIGGVRRSGGDSHWFTGVVDEVSIWSAALDPAQVTALAGGATPLEVVDGSDGDNGDNGGGASVENVLITEFLASNDEGLMDGFDGFSDWIELYNPTEETVNLEGLFLTDQEGEARWAFPSESLGPGAYLIVFASGQDTETNGEWHTNFRLDRSAGGYLGLLDSNGQTVISEFKNYPAQKSDISYGRSAEGAHQYYRSPTPGGQNGNGLAGFAADTAFSHDRGFYSEPFALEITTATEGATIIYTVDGTPPRPGTLFAGPVGIVYDGPVAIQTTTTVRAMAFKAGFEPTNIDTQTYLYIDDVIQQPAQPEGWPEDWGSDSEIPGRVVADYEMDPRVVENALPGYSVKEALLDIPTLSVVMDPEEFIGPNGIYIRPRDRLERGGSLELIHPDGTEGFQIDCAVEIHGNSSRRPWRMQKHSLRVSFKSEYGPGSLDYPVVPGAPADEYNKLVLRACFTDSWGLVSWGPSRYRPNDSQYIRDVWMKESMGDMGNATTYGTFMHLYVNGLYWGLVNPAEKIEAETMASHDESEPEDWDVMSDFNDLVAGSREAWSALFAAARRDLRDLNNYEALLQWLDPQNFSDYMILHFYADAEDWPHHNGAAARNRALNGRFQWLVWDQEIVLDNHAMRRFGDSTSNAPGELFQALRESEEFKLVFNDRLHKHTAPGGALSVEASQARYRRIADRIDKAIVAESARWGDTQSSTPYGNRIDQPSSPDAINHPAYPPAPHGPDYYFTREDSWVVERDNVIDNYIPAILDRSQSNSLLRKLEDEDLLISLGAPALEPPGGEPAAGDVVAMTGGAEFDATSTIYYTLDGSDPRLLGGDIGGSALAYDAPVELTRSSPVRARLLKRSNNPFIRTGTWSPLTEAFYRVGDFGSVQDVMISEIHYQPAPPTAEEMAAGFTRRGDFEFLELFNSGDMPVILEGLQVSDGIRFTFVRGSHDELAPGAAVLLVSNAEAFAMRYGTGLPVAGVFERESRLSNGGERLALTDAGGTEFLAFAYSDTAPWAESADGDGFSLVLQDPAGEADPNKGTSWSASAQIGGSPGETEAPSGYEIWKQRHFTPEEREDPAISGPVADPDGDGLANLLECGVDTDPKAPTAAVLDVAWNAGKLELIYRENQAVPEVTLTLEMSSELTAWEDAAESFSWVRTDSEKPDVADVTVIDEAPLAPGSLRLFRLRAVMEPGG